MAKKKDNTLSNELDNLEKNPNVEDNNSISDPDHEPELSIVDKFVAGDLDGVKKDVHDQVVQTVSTVVNAPAIEPEPKK